jgi:hypothetical protein
VRTPGTVQWPKELPGNPATDFVTLKAETLDRPAVAGIHLARVGGGLAGGGDQHVDGRGARHRGGDRRQ